MPIPVPTTAPPPPGPGTDPVWAVGHPRRTITLTGGNGDTIDVTNRAGGFHVYGDGVRGLGVVDEDVQRQAGAGGGTVVTGILPSERIVDLPFWCDAEDVPTFTARKQRVREIFNHRRYGPAVLRVRHPSGESRSAEVYATSGLREEHGPGLGGPTYQYFPMVLVAPSPDATSSIPIRVTIGGGSGPATIPFGPGLRPARARVFGALELRNVGDAYAHGVWTITGPGGPVTVRSDTEDVDWFLDVELEAEQVRIVDTESGTVVDELGASRYTELGPAPHLWPLPPGLSLVTVEMDGATSESEIRFDGFAAFRALA